MALRMHPAPGFEEAPSAQLAEGCEGAANGKEAPGCKGAASGPLTRRGRPMRAALVSLACPRPVALLLVVELSAFMKGLAGVVALAAPHARKC